MTNDARAIFADIDSMEPDKFVLHLTPDVVFRFGNADPIKGRDAVREAVAGFYSSISGMTHHLLATYESGDVLVVKADVEYLRQDGTSVTVPNADILTLDGDLVADWQIYIDIAPVYA